MFCKTNRNTVAPENVGKFVGLMKEKWSPLISKQEGFKNAYILAKQSGEVIAIMVWDKEEQLLAWNDNPEHTEVSKEIMPLFTGTAGVDVWEVQHILSK